jgi:phasin family protein
LTHLIGDEGMYTDFFKSFTDQTEKTLEPYFKFNKLLTKNVEVLTELQLKSIKTYSDIGISQMKAASDVKDLPSLAAFNTQQLTTLSKLSQQMVDDSNKLQSIAKEFKEDVEKLTTENLSTVTPA